ncbi:MAG: hypothetical protein H6622_03765 [Halobacteriovoraceae bacterium]|nr:hypothetical protein [Halobacteriovoraceae bacterium]
MNLDNAVSILTLFCLSWIFAWNAPIGPVTPTARCPASKLVDCMTSTKNLLLVLPKKSFSKVSRYFETLSATSFNNPEYLLERKKMFVSYEHGDYTPFYPENLKTPEQFLSFISIALEQEGKTLDMKLSNMNLYRRWRANVNMKQLINGEFDRSDYELYLMIFLEHLNNGKFSFLNTLTKNPYTSKGQQKLLEHLAEEQMLYVFLENYSEVFAKNGPIKRLQSKIGKNVMPVPNFTINLFFNALIWDFLPIKYPLIAYFYDANRPHLINGNYGKIGARERYNFWKTYVSPAMFIYFMYSLSNPDEQKVEEIEEQNKIFESAGQKIEEKIRGMEKLTQEMESIIKNENDDWAFKCSLFVKCLELHKNSLDELPSKDDESFKKCLTWLIPELRPFCSNF